MMEELKLFGKRLREAREERNLTARELAEMLGTTAATISRYETGVHDPKRVFIQQAAIILGVSPAWLMGANVDKYESDTKPCVKIPLIGTIAAGTPIFAHENIEGYEWVSESEKVDFCLRVKGDSMIGARIYDGDLVYVRKQDYIENGEIAVVLVDDEATLKRVYKVDGNIILHPENPAYKDIVYSKKDAKNIKILGKAISLKGALR